MRNIFKRSLSAMLILMLIVSIFAGISISAGAATVNYQYGSTDAYSNVIVNWGIREEVATFLSPNAQDFYEDTTYEDLIALSGSSTLSSVSTSELYVQLNSLMKSAHTSINSYDDSRDLFQYTDCQNNGATSTKISAFYSGTEVGPAWDSGSTWNREHTWPNSKGGDGDNEDDIMMLRPETASNNSSRGNKAYGQSSGYYYPNMTDTYDVRGDAARTILYVYVRWGLDEQAVLDYMWGSDGVFESLNVLLTWMEEDPVDTWEMGRNDSVQSITGTRNVFIDYPELAFALFDQEIPEMQTPSGNAGSAGYEITALSGNTAYGTVSLSGSVITATPASGYRVAGYSVTSGTATVVQNGNTFTVKASSDCTVTVNFEKIPTHTVRVLENGIQKAFAQVDDGAQYTLPAFSGELPEGYSFVGWTTAEVDGVNQKPTVYTAGGAVTITAATTFYALASYFDADAEAGENVWTLVTDASQLSAGSQVIIAAKDYDVAMSTTQNSNNRGQAAVTKSSNTLTYDTAVDVFTLETGSVSGSYGFHGTNGYIYAVNNTSNYLRTTSSLTAGACFYISPTSDGTCAITSATYTGSTGAVPMQYNNSNSIFSCYPKATQKALSLYVGVAAGGATTYVTSWESGDCSHSNETAVVTAATCTEMGYTTYSCADCGEVLSVEDYVDALGHNEVTVAGTPATLSQPGTTDRIYCDRCDMVIQEQEVIPALTDVTGWSLTLGSDLAVNFMLNLDDSILDTAVVRITVGAAQTEYAASQLTEQEDGAYRVSVLVGAAQMTEQIRVQVQNGQDLSQEKTYSVKSYADTVLAGEYSDELKALVSQMLYYGAATQTYFSYRTDDMADADLQGITGAAPQSAQAVSITGQADGIALSGATLLLRNRVAIRYYFSVTGDISAYTFTINGVSYTPVEKDGLYYVEFADIAPQDLDESVTVTVNGSYSITYSPMNYMVNMNKKGSDTLKALVQALYAYYLAAESYLAA